MVASAPRRWRAATPPAAFHPVRVRRALRPRVRPRAVLFHPATLPRAWRRLRERAMPALARYPAAMPPRARPILAPTAAARSMHVPTAAASSTPVRPAAVPLRAATGEPVWLDDDAMGAPASLTLAALRRSRYARLAAATTTAMKIEKIGCATALLAGAWNVSATASASVRRRSVSMAIARSAASTPIATER
jgi:hypothetical protein